MTAILFRDARLIDDTGAGPAARETVREGVDIAKIVPSGQ